MTLVLTLALTAFAFAALFWALGVLVQGYFYNQAASYLPLRAALAGLLVGLYITGWAYVNTRAASKDQYGTLFEFNPTTQKDVVEFEAIRRLAIKDASGQPKEAVVPFKWVPEGKLGKFVQPPANQDFRLNSADYMTIALDIPFDGQKVRFEAAMESNGTYARDGESVIFTEKGGTRYLESERLHRVFIPSRSALIGALALNLSSLVVMLVAFWPITRFSLGHALILSVIFAVAFQGLMPMVFQKNELPPESNVQTK